MSWFSKVPEKPNFEVERSENFTKVTVIFSKKAFGLVVLSELLASVVKEGERYSIYDQYFIATEHSYSVEIYLKIEGNHETNFASSTPSL